MTMANRWLGLLVVPVLIFSLSATAQARRRGPVVVGEDPAGDWALEGVPAGGQVGEALGQDLISASIDAGKSTVTFIFGLASLDAQPSGVFTWDMTIGKKAFRITNLPCDPSDWVTAPGTLPDPNTGACESSPAGPLTTFDLMECGVPRTVNIIYNCAYKSTIEAVVDTSADSISVSVPTDLLRAKGGAAIKPSGIDGAAVAVSPVPAGATVPAPGDVLKISRSSRLP
jgi:hypothetical protein